MRHLKSLIVFMIFAGALAVSAQTSPDPSDPLGWPETQRAFLQDGPGFLLTEQQRRDVVAMSLDERERFMFEFVDKDPIPETPVNELRVGIEKRQRLALQKYPSPLDVRARILFLNGAPKEIKALDCGFVFVPLEIWSYQMGTGFDGKPALRQLVVYKPSVSEPWQLWLPSDSKRSLYTDTMQYWLEQWEEYRQRSYIKRLDLQVCKDAKDVDEATGVWGLTGALGAKDRAWIKPKDASPFLEAPKDLAAWARAAAATEVPEAPSSLKVASLDFRYPQMAAQRMVTRAYVSIESAGVKTYQEGDRKPEVILAVDGIVESDGKPFGEFRLRYRMPASTGGEPLPLVLEQSLRPGEQFVLRLHIVDETGKGEARVVRAFRVPRSPTGDDLESRISAGVGDLLPEATAKGRDSLLLLPPPSDVVLGLWRAESLVTGERIKKVVFLVDGVKQLTRTSSPYSAELRLSRFPSEQVVRAEGYDEKGELVASDEVILNQPRGALAVWITDPPKGVRLQPGKTTAKAEISVPDGRRLESVEFKVNDQSVATLTKPPWQAEVPVPSDEVAYVTIVATLDDGGRSEAVRFVRAPQYFEEVEVNLVELYIAVTDRSGNLAQSLGQDDFEVLEDGKKQDISKFELVENLPLTVGILLDTSGSMSTSLVQAQQAAAGFLRSVMTPKDRSFAVTFSSQPRLAMPPTDDVEAVARSFEESQAVGDTALHDALVHSLYYFRGVKGQRALVLLSDGDDNSSYISYKDALEYARRSGVAIYAIGFNLPGFATGLRGKLADLSESTGGKAFFTSKPEELPAVYAQIERELRNRYLVAYNSNATDVKPGIFREVEVRMKRKDLKARTARGYYQ